MEHGLDELQALVRVNATAIDEEFAHILLHLRGQVTSQSDRKNESERGGQSD